MIKRILLDDDDRPYKMHLEKWISNQGIIIKVVGGG